MLVRRVIQPRRETTATSSTPIQRYCQPIGAKTQLALLDRFRSAISSTAPGTRRSTTRRASTGSAIGSTVAAWSWSFASPFPAVPATETSTRRQPSWRQMIGSTTATPCTRSKGTVSEVRLSRPRSIRNPCSTRLNR